MISCHLRQYVDNNCVGGAQMDVLLEQGGDGAKRAVIRLTEMDDDKEDVNIRLWRHDDKTAECVFGSGGMEDESQVFHDAAEKVVEWMMGWSNLDVRIFNRLTSDFLLRGSFKMDKGGPTSQVVGDSPPRGEGSEAQPVQAQGASSQQLPHKRARSGTPPQMVDPDVSFAVVAARDDYLGGRERVDDPIARFERLANGTREEQIALYQDIIFDKPEVASVPYSVKSQFVPRIENMLQSELRSARLARNAPQTVDAAPSHSAPAAVAQKRGEGVHESAAGPSIAKDPPATSKPVATGDMPPPRSRERGKGVVVEDDVFDMTRSNVEGGGPLPSTFYVQAERATHAAIMYSISLDQHPSRSKVKIASTWTAAVDEYQKGLSEALATYKGKALKGKGNRKEVEVADAPVSLLEKWEKSPVSQDDDDILDVNDEIAKGKRLRQQLAVQPRDLNELSKALVHRNRVWTRNLFVGPPKLLARDLHLSRAEQNATIFANSESDYGHDKLVIPVWRYSFQFLADRFPNAFYDWMKKDDTQREVAQLFGDIAGTRTMKAGYARARTDEEINVYLQTSSAKEMAEAASTRVLTGPGNTLDDLKPVDVRKAALLDSLCKSAWAMVPLERKPLLPPAICGFLVLDGNHFTTLIKSVRFQLVTDNMTVDQRSVWYKAMLNGFMKAEKVRVIARGGKEQEVTKTVAAAKLEEWATDWKKFGGVDVQMLRGETILPTWWQIREQKVSEPVGKMIEVVRQLGNAMNAEDTAQAKATWGSALGDVHRAYLAYGPLKRGKGVSLPTPLYGKIWAIVKPFWQKGEQAKAEGDGAGDKAGGAEETDKWGPDQKNFMQRWLFWCEDPLKPVVDGKPAIAQGIASRQDFLDARPEEKAHELSIFTAHRELASFQYFDSLIQAPIMSGEAPPSNLPKRMEVAKNLIEGAKQFAHIKFLENPDLIGSCRELNGTFDPVVVREQVFGVKLEATFDTDLDKFIAECHRTTDFWRVVVTATRAIILTLRDLPQAKRKVVDLKDWKFPRGLLASHPRHLYDDLGVQPKHLLGVPEAATAEVEEEVLEEGTAKAKRGWRDRLEAFSYWKGVWMGSDWIAYRTMTWKENEKRKDLVVTKVVDELYTGSENLPGWLKDQTFAVLDLTADSNEKWRNLHVWDPDCIPDDSQIPKPSSHLSTVAWDVVDKITNALFKGPCRVLLVFGLPAHIRRWKRLVDLIKYRLRKGEEETPVRFPRGSASGTVSGEAGRVVGQAAIGAPVAQPGPGGNELPPNASPVPCGQPEKTYEELMAEAADVQGQKAKGRGGGRRGAGQETEGADKPAQPQKGGGQGRDATAEKPIRDVRPDVRMRFMDGAKLRGRGGWTSKWVEDVWISWQHKYPKKEDFLLFGTLLGKEKNKVVIRWFDEGHDLGWSDESEEKYRFPLKFASEHVTLLKEGASWDNIPSHRPGKR
eukprot:jgi/Mesvir1/16647/Mv10186-RA.1